MHCITKKLPLRFWENIWLVCTDQSQSTKITYKTSVIKTDMYVSKKSNRNMERFWL